MRYLECSTSWVCFLRLPLDSTEKLIVILIELSGSGKIGRKQPRPLFQPSLNLPNKTAPFELYDDPDQVLLDFKGKCTNTTYYTIIN